MTVRWTVFSVLGYQGQFDSSGNGVVLAMASLTISRANGGRDRAFKTALSRAYQSENSRYCSIMPFPAGPRSIL